MIRFLLILCFSLCIYKGDKVISWSETSKLTWDNFQGEPKPSLDAVATTASGITFRYFIKQSSSGVIGFNTIVKAHFYPEKSWYKVKLANNYILAHEQLHFDITELYARKFRKRIKDLNLSNGIKEELEELHETVNQELSKMQQKYDAETDFSRNPEQQAKWHKYIALELEKLDTFKSKS